MSYQREFEKRLNDLFSKHPDLEVPYIPTQEGEWFGPLLNFLLPLLVIILIWIMLMRKMGGGASGTALRALWCELATASASSCCLRRVTLTHRVNRRRRKSSSIRDGSALRDYGRRMVMPFNRSAPRARVVPVLTVTDVRAAVEWYSTVFGFVEHVRIGEAHRAQLGLREGGPAELIVAEVRPGRRPPTPDLRRSHQVMIKVADVEAVIAEAISRGGVLDDPVRDWEYGERQAAMRDPFGHQWVLTQTVVDTAPESWGGQTITPREP
jgi:uncharacterized glyoxalase superfamily protein PhnB